MKEIQEKETGAFLSDCRNYRWALWRTWDSDLPHCVFIGLNPSTADEIQDDPTIRRCKGFAKSWDFGGLIMVNAFGYRATDPKEMKRAEDPIGKENDRIVREICNAVIEKGGMIVAAWGSHCSEKRESEFCKLIHQPIYCLGKTKKGQPKHPLYLKSDTKPEIFWQP